MLHFVLTTKILDTTLHDPLTTQAHTYILHSTLLLITSPPEGVARYCFHPVCLSVCLSVCLCVCVSGRYLVFYFSAIRRDIDLKFIQDTYIVVLNSMKNIDLHMSKVKVTGTVHCFLKVQSYHKNWAIEKFQLFFIDTS